MRAPLLEPQEPRYAEIPRQMLQRRPLSGAGAARQPYLDKPPLLYWLVMGSYAVFGVHDWAARLVPGLAGVLTVLLTYWWGRRVVGERAGLCGALVLCLSAGFVYRQRMLNMDSLLCLWVTAALASAHAAVTTGRLLRLAWWLLSAAACGLGLLTKGPVALVLIVAPLLFYLVPGAATVRAVTLRDWLAFRVAGRDVGRAVVRRRDGASAGLRSHLLLAAPRRTLPHAVRSRETGLVLSARPARRHAAVDAAVAGLRAFPRPPLAARRSAPPGRPGIFPLIISVVSAVLLGVRLQASRVHPAGHAGVALALGCY